MANASGTPQGALYAARGANTAPSDGNAQRNRSAEQQYSQASGNPYNYQGRGSGMNYAQFLNGQDPSLSRYVPSTLRSSDPTQGNNWNNYPGGYGYNLPTAFGGFGGFSQFSRQDQASRQQPPSPQIGPSSNLREEALLRQARQGSIKPGNQQVGGYARVPRSYGDPTGGVRNPSYEQLIRMLQPGGSIGGPNRAGA